MGFEPKKAPLLALYRRLFEEHGPQSWWPAESLFEVMVGAVLTQNTSWKGVERAIDALRDAGALDPDGMLSLDPRSLARLIRPAGYFNVKSARLLNLCRALSESGGLTELERWPTDRLRAYLLEINGVGPETADDILLYGFERPVFVVDAYTRRLLFRLGLSSGDESYEEMRLGIESALGPDPALYNEFHALIVVHGKACCRPAPRCSACCLTETCGFSK